VSARVEGATALILVTIRGVLSVGAGRLSLSAREGDPSWLKLVHASASAHQPAASTR